MKDRLQELLSIYELGLINERSSRPSGKNYSIAFKAGEHDRPTPQRVQRYPSIIAARSTPAKKAPIPSCATSGPTSKA